MTFSNFNVDRTQNFPYLTILVDEVNIKGSHYDIYGKDLLRVNQLSLVLPPWELINQKYSFHNVAVDSTTIFLIKDSLGRNNTDFLKKLIKPKGTNKTLAKEEQESKDKVRLEQMHFHHVVLDINNTLKKQAFKVALDDATIKMSRKSDFQNILLAAQCQFEGLYFNKEKGGFLKNKKASLKLDIDLNDALVKLNPSLLNVEGDILKLEGNLTKADTGYLHLNIKSEGILLERASSLLTPAIQKALSPFEIDQPITTEFDLSGPLIPGRPPAIHIDFSTEDTQLKFKDLAFSKLKLNGNFSNDCFVKDYIKSSSGCLIIHEFEGLLLDKIPTKLSGRINDLKQLNDVEAIGQLQLPFNLLKEYAAQVENIDLRKGGGTLNFDYKGNPNKLINKQFNQQKRLKASIQLEDIALDFKQLSLPLQIKKGQIQLDRTTLKLKDVDLRIPGIGGQMNGEIKNALPFLLGENKRLTSDIALTFQQMAFDKFIKETNLFNHKKDTLLGAQLAGLITQVTDLMDANLQLNIKEFTNEAFNAQDITCAVKVEKNCTNDTSLESEACLYVADFGAKVLQDIETSGHFSITDMADPELNTALVIALPVTTAANYLNNPQFSVKTGKVELAAKSSFHLNDYQQIDNLLERMVFNSTIQLKDISATYLPQEFALEHLDAQIHVNQDTLLFDSLTFQYGDITPKISGNITHFLPLAFGKKHAADVDLTISLATLDLENRAIIDSTSTTQVRHTPFVPSAYNAKLEDIFNIIDGKIGLRIQDLRLPDYPIENLSFLINMDKSCNTEKEGIHCIGVENFHADVFGDIPIDGHFTIKDLKDPSLSMSLDALMPMHDLNRLLYNDNFVAHTGEVALHFDYEVPISDELTPQHYILASDLKGQFKFKNVGLTYPERDYRIDALNGVLRFDETSLDIDTLDLRINENQIYANGHCPDFLPYFFLEGKALYIDARVNSPSFDIGSFNTPRTIQKTAIPVLTEENQQERINAIDQILEQGVIIFNTAIEELKYESFIANEVVGKVHLGKDSIKLDRLNMRIASGQFGLNGLVTNMAKHEPTLAVTAYFKGVDIEKVFKAFQNFGQKEITHANVKGELFANGHFKADLDNHYAVKPASIQGGVKIKVSDGELIEFPALKKMTSFLFKKRHLEDIYFDTLLTNLHFDGLDVKIDHFNIHSSAATLGIDGIYTFSDKDKTHIFFEVPISNLFKKYIDRSVIKKHRKKRAGLPILIEAKEIGKKIKFKLKLFKRRHEK